MVEKRGNTRQKGNKNFVEEVQSYVSVTLLVRLRCLVKLIGVGLSRVDVTAGCRHSGILEDSLFSSFRNSFFGIVRYSRRECLFCCCCFVLIGFQLEILEPFSRNVSVPHTSPNRLGKVLLRKGKFPFGRARWRRRGGGRRRRRGGPTSSASPLLHFFSSSTVSWNNKERARNCWLAPFSRSIYGRFHVNFEQLFPSRSNGGQILLVKRWISSWISGRFPPPSFVQLTTPFSWLIDSVAIQKEEKKNKKKPTRLNWRVCLTQVDRFVVEFSMASYPVDWARPREKVAEESPPDGVGVHQVDRENETGGKESGWCATSAGMAIFSPSLFGQVCQRESPWRDPGNRTGIPKVNKERSFR